ncbi:hypothetical protein [Sphingomonas sp. Leaf257]|jgi:hypothetical protein|uniref:hypothetical protein n=1 Tax=Sphingomonas sp. Leaf257 TaxID=1736309 RepID=UPI0006FA18BA|nr:hypothetical protein [Sphingomonas sp. Leaf257]KQO51416.1 hypothetical protein ASF14_07920 [Sphingomonas sp. Leaf257]
MSKLRVDFAGGRFSVGKRSFARAADVAGMTVIGAGGITLASDGRLRLSPAGQPRIVASAGLKLEPAATNLLTMRNAAPTSIDGYARLSNRPSGADILVADDSAALAASGIFDELLAAGVMSGKVIRCINPSDTDFAVPFANAAGGQRLGISAYVRCVKGSGYLTVTGGGGSTPDFSGPEWRRVGRVHTATASGGQARLIVRAGSEVLIILPQVELDRITSPIVTLGQAATRGAETLVDVAPRYSRPHTILIELELDRADGIDRRVLTLVSPTGGEIAVSRTIDNALSVTSTASPWRPRIARVLGPGRLRVALRVSPRGWTLAAAGMLRHDCWREPPAGLSRLIIGADAAGGTPLNGTIRSVEVRGELSDGALAQWTATGTMVVDAARYVSPTGDDTADGTTPAKAWKSLAVAAMLGVLAAGSELRLARGGTWAETLYASYGCTYTGFGAGDRPRVGGGSVGVDENGQSLWRLDGLCVTGATQRGVNTYGGSGIIIDTCEVTGNGSRTDPNAIAIALRGNTRRAVAVLQLAPADVQVTGIGATEAALTGVFRLECTTGGSGGETRWQIRRPDGSVVGTASGGVAYSSSTVGISFTIAGTAAIGDVVELRTLPFREIAFPGNALAEDVAVRRCYVHDNYGLRTGNGAGDGIYCEGIGGVTLIEACDVPPPEGAQADCIQIGRSTALYVRNPAYAIVRNNCVVAFTGGGKGAIVVRSETCLIEGNRVRGHNFCIGVMASGIVRWNYCENANLYPYSWAIGPGEDNDVVSLHIYGNVIVGCRRGISSSGNGTTTMTLDGRVVRLQYRKDFVANDNDIRDADVGLFIDRPTGGVLQSNRATNVAKLLDIRITALPPGETELRTDQAFARAAA